MKAGYQYAWMVVAAVVIIISLSVIIYNAGELERKVLEIKYEVGDKTGFNVEGERLNFGRLLPGSKGTRSLSLHNTHDFPIKVRVSPELRMRDLLSYNKSVQYLEPNQTLRMDVTLTVPTTLEYGNYTSFIVVHIRK